MTLASDIPWFVLLSIYMLVFHTYLQMKEAKLLGEDEYPIIIEDYDIRLKITAAYAIGATLWILIPHSFWVNCISCCCNR